MVRPRRLVSGLFLGAVLAATAGCAGTVPNPTPSASPSASTTQRPVPPLPPSRSPSTSPTAAPAGFPAAPRPYAEAALAAWAGHQVNRLSDLTTPVVRQQILELPGLPDQRWSYQTCSGAAGSYYCAFINADGDSITLRVANQQVGKPNAITEVRFDRTTYPPDATEYVKGFVEAWRNNNTARMLTLSGPAEVAYFTELAPPDRYSVCSAMSGGTWQARIYSTAGANYLLQVSATGLGDKHAITGHLAPSPPPPCA